MTETATAVSSFAKSLFLGEIHEDLVFPYPKPDRDEQDKIRGLIQRLREIGAPRLEVAEKLEEAALAELKARKPDRVLATNVEFWSAVVLDFAEVPPDLFTPMFASARVGGWAAHIMEQKREGRLIRPTAKYIGPGPRTSWSRSARAG